MQPLTIRPAGPSDLEAIARLAQLDSKRTPSGDVLVALYGQAPVAALDVERDLAVADPFAFSAQAVELLRLRAAQQRRRARPRVSWRPAQAR